jgi:hypothetical protein
MLAPVEELTLLAGLIHQPQTGAPKTTQACPCVSNGNTQTAFHELLLWIGGLIGWGLLAPPGFPCFLGLAESPETINKWITTLERLPMLLKRIAEICRARG